MSRSLNLICLLCLAVAISGCNKKDKEETTEAAIFAPPKDLIAVIDLNVVAEEIGAQTKIDFLLKKKEEELINRFNGLKEELRRKVDSLSTANQDLNDQKQNALDELTAENQNMLTLEMQAAQTQLVAFHSQLKQKLLGEIRPVAYQVAQEKGMQIVLTVGQVYAAGPNVNITYDVAKRIKKNNEASAANEKPAKQPPRVAELPGGGEFTPR